MKHLLITSLVLLLVACSSPSEKYEKSAIDQVHKIVKKVAKNPESFNISDIETGYKSDSICVIRFNGSGENSFGGRSSGRYEFVMLSRFLGTDKQVTICSVNKLDDTKSVLVKYKDMNTELPNDKKTKDDSLFVYCSLQIFSSKGIYTGVVKDLTRDKDVLQSLIESGQ